MTDPTPAARVAQAEAADAKKLADDEVLIAAALYRASMKEDSE